MIAGKPTCHNCGILKTEENTFIRNNRWGTYCKQCHYAIKRERYLYIKLHGKAPKKKDRKKSLTVDLINAETTFKEKPFGRYRLIAAQTARRCNDPMLYFQFCEQL